MIIAQNSMTTFQILTNSQTSLYVMKHGMMYRNQVSIHANVISQLDLFQ